MRLVATSCFLTMSPDAVRPFLQLRLRLDYTVCSVEGVAIRNISRVASLPHRRQTTALLRPNKAMPEWDSSSLIAAGVARWSATTHLHKRPYPLFDCIIILIRAISRRSSKKPPRSSTVQSSPGVIRNTPTVHPRRTLTHQQIASSWRTDSPSLHPSIASHPH